VVENTTVLSGTQAVQYDATGLSGQDVVAHLLPYNSVGNPEQVVRIQEAFFLSATGTASSWVVFADSNTANQFLGAVGVLSNNTAILLGSGSAGSVPVNRGQWNSFEMDQNFQTQTQSAFVNGVFIGEVPFATAATGLFALEFGVLTSPGTDQAFVDNLSVTSTTAVPEPSTLTLLSLGSLSLLGYGWRRRKQAAV
jgi:hypothetical protein